MCSCSVTILQHLAGKGDEAVIVTIAVRLDHFDAHVRMCAVVALLQYLAGKGH